MWKCAKRSLKATFRRGVLSTESPQNKDLWQLRLTPAVVEHYNQFYNAYKNKYENFIKGKKDRERPKEKAWFSGVFDSDLFCALTWGGVFALGYSYMQYKVKIFSYLHHKKLEFYTTGYHKSLGYLIYDIGIKPYNYVIPEVQAAKSKNGRQQFTEFASQNFKSDDINFSALEKAYQRVLGMLNNSLGAQCMQLGQHKEAVEYFIQSAKEGHAPGIFNLGICHERGLGTNQDFKMAAELYRKAAELGHATAMYNLGVFYAQGRGGIQADLNQARELFKAAANLGQTDALEALKLDKQATGKTSERDLVSPSKEKDANTLSHFLCEELLNCSSLNFLQNFNACDDEVKSNCDPSDYSQGKEIDSLQCSDSGVLDLSPENEQYVTLV